MLLKIIIFSLFVFFPVFSQTPLKKVAVFCSGDDKISECFKREAFSLGEMLAQAQVELITGGSNTGLMKEVVDGFVGSRKSFPVYGVLPHILKPYNVSHPFIKEGNILWVGSVHERLEIFMDQSDVVITLPGGFGTLHELLDFLVHQQFGLINKRLILLNISGYWNELLALFRKMVEENALQQKHLCHLLVADTVEQCIQYIIDEKEAEISNQGLKDRFWEKSS